MRMNLIAFAALALGAAAPAIANDFVVKHSDLDLAAAKDQKILERRIDAAAREYCSTDAIQTGTRIKSTSASKCYQDARNAARERMATLVAEAQRGG